MALSDYVPLLAQEGMRDELREAADRRVVAIDSAFWAPMIAAECDRISREIAFWLRIEPTYHPTVDRLYCETGPGC